MEPCLPADVKLAASALQVKDAEKAAAKSNLSEEEEMKWALHVLKGLSGLESQDNGEEDKGNELGHSNKTFQKDSSDIQEEEMMEWALRTLERTKYLSDTEDEEERKEGKKKKKTKKKEKQERQVPSQPAHSHKRKAVNSEVHCKELRVVLTRLTEKEIQQWTQQTVAKQTKVEDNEKNLKKTKVSDESATLSNSTKVTSALIRVVPMEKLCYAPATCKETPPLVNWNATSSNILHSLLRDSPEPLSQQKNEDLNSRELFKRIMSGISTQPTIFPCAAQSQQSRFRQLPFTALNTPEQPMQLVQQSSSYRSFSSSNAMPCCDPYLCPPSCSAASARGVCNKTNCYQSHDISTNPAIRPPVITKEPSYSAPSKNLSIPPDSSHHGSSAAVAAANPAHRVSVIKRVGAYLRVRDKKSTINPSCCEALNLTINSSQPSSITSPHLPGPTQFNCLVPSQSSIPSDLLHSSIIKPRDLAVAVTVSLPNFYHSLKNSMPVTSTVSTSSQYPLPQISLNSRFPEKSSTSAHCSFAVSPGYYSPGGNWHTSLHSTSNISNISTPYSTPYTYGTTWYSNSITTASNSGSSGLPSQKSSSYGSFQSPHVNGNPYTINPSFKSYANYSKSSAIAMSYSSNTFPHSYAHSSI